MRLSLSAAEPWQLFFSTVLSAAGWAAMGGAAINALIAPWFVRLRPPALSWAYNAASIGGHPPPQRRWCRQDGLSRSYQPGRRMIGLRAAAAA
jgi:hypothetical protein